MEEIWHIGWPKKDFQNVFRGRAKSAPSHMALLVSSHWIQMEPVDIFYLSQAQNELPIGHRFQAREFLHHSVIPWPLS